MQEFLQVDIHEFFTRERSWRQLYNFLGRLPYWGHYKSAVSMDEEWAKEILNHEEKQQAHAPLHMTSDEPVMTPLGYSEVVARLDLIADRLLRVENVIIAQHAKEGQVPSFTPLTRPTTAYEIERERRVFNELNEIDRMVRDIGVVVENGWGEPT